MLLVPKDNQIGHIQQVVNVGRWIHLLQFLFQGKNLCRSYSQTVAMAATWTTQGPAQQCSMARGPPTSLSGLPSEWTSSQGRGKTALPVPPSE